MKKIIHPDEVIPPWYGIAYRRYDLNHAVCYPLFINLLVMIIRAIFYALRYGHIGVRDDPRQAYAQGVADGQQSRRRPLTKEERAQLLYAAERFDWLADRMVFVYKESCNVDFVQTARRNVEFLRELAK